MLQALNTGHDGSLTTVHANSPADALRRVETLALMAGVGLPHAAVRDQVASALDVVVHQARLPDGARVVESVTEVVRVAGGAGTRELYRAAAGCAAGARAAGERLARLRGQGRARAAGAGGRRVASARACALLARRGARLVAARRAAALLELGGRCSPGRWRVRRAGAGAGAGSWRRSCARGARGAIPGAAERRRLLARRARRSRSPPARSRSGRSAGLALARRRAVGRRAAAARSPRALPARRGRRRAGRWRWRSPTPSAAAARCARPLGEAAQRARRVRPGTSCGARARRAGGGSADGRRARGHAPRGRSPRMDTLVAACVLQRRAGRRPRRGCCARAPAAMEEQARLEGEVRAATAQARFTGAARGAAAARRRAARRAGQPRLVRRALELVPHRVARGPRAGAPGGRRGADRAGSGGVRW